MIISLLFLLEGLPSLNFIRIKVLRQSSRDIGDSTLLEAKA